MNKVIQKEKTFRRIGLSALLLLLFTLGATAQDKDFICYRGALTNAFTRFTQEKKGCVAFLGGSITEMKGWREMVQADLRRRFPDTEFQFIDAGISSLGSTPHAFRFEHDVLDQGTPDLLFLEAAVNDATNGFPAELQIKSMEGIIRHALAVNPLMDIVMMHFAFDDFFPVYARGEVPPTILNHEQVAEHYGITSLHLAQEIAHRIDAGELTWATFGGVHPAPLGHTYYAAAIGKVFDHTQQQLDATAVRRPHALPKPLDAKSFTKGKQIPVSAAKKLKGFAVDDDFNPNEGLETRRQFVHIPVLCADEAGASLSLTFKGTAIGIFCEAGPQTGVISYTIDNGPRRTLDTFTDWSNQLYLPFIYMLDSNLRPGRHKLRLQVEDGDRTKLQIVYFAVNGK